MKKPKYNKDFKIDFNSFFGDWDKDGVMNGVDCQPRNKHAQDSYIGVPNRSNYIRPVVKRSPTYINYKPTVVKKSFITPKKYGGSSYRAPVVTQKSSASIRKYGKPKQPSIRKFPTSTTLRNATPNWNKVSVGDVRASGYNSLSEMKSEYKSNPEKFRAKTGYGYKDKYGNVSRTPQDYKTITGYSGTDRINIIKQSGKISSGPRPIGWDKMITSQLRYPDLNIASNISKRDLDRNLTLPAEALKSNSNKMYMDKNKKIIINPYQQQRYISKGTVRENVPRPYGWGPRGSGPVLAKGYKIDTSRAFLPAEAVLDQNARVYVDKERTMVVNPYYKNVK